MIKLYLFPMSINSLDKLNLNIPSQGALSFASEAARYTERSPLRPADWRWKLANVVYSNPEYAKLAKDPMAKMAIKFVKALYSACTDSDHNKIVKLCNKYPDLFSAWQLYDNRALARHKAELEARILASESPDQILLKTSLTPEIYNLYCAMFYDVQSKLGSFSYILHCVIFSDLSSFIIDSEERLIPFLGYLFGPAAVDFCVKRTNQNNWEDFSEALPEEAKKRMELQCWSAVQSDDVEQMDILYKLYTGLELTNKTGRVGNVVDTVQNLLASITWDMAARSKLKSSEGSE